MRNTRLNFRQQELTPIIYDKPHPHWAGARLSIAKILLIFILIMSQLPVVAAALHVNDFTFSHLGLADGLNSQRIYSLKQTDDGAVWITTKSCVARYNGVIIENFDLTEKPGMRNVEECNPRFVQSAEKVLQVFDAGGRIYEYNPVQNRFDLVADVAVFFKQYNKLNDVYKEGDTYWLAMGDGVFMLHGGRLVSVASDMFANCIIRGPEGILLFGTRKGVKSLSPRQKDSPHRSLSPYLPYVVVSGYYDVDTKRLWLGTYDQGLIVIDENGVCMSVEGIPNHPVRDIVCYDSTTMLVGVDGCGVLSVSRLPSAVNRASLLFNANEGDCGVLHGNGIYALLVDSWGNLFIGSYSGGIDIARPVGSTVVFYKQQHNNKQALLNDHVNCVVQLSSSALAMGTDDGISILNPLTGEWRHIARGVVVLSLTPDPDGRRLLAATYGNGVCEIGAKGEVRELYGVDVLGENHVHVLLFDRNGHLWIGCQDAQLVEVLQGKKHYYPIYNTKTLTLLPDGRIAVGTVRGLYIVTPGEKEVKELLYYSPDSNPVNQYVQDLFVHDERYIDIATDGDGLYVYDLRTGQCRQFTMKNGLPSNTVTSITQDDFGRLWFATDRGLSFAHPDSLDKIINVNYIYGLQRVYSYDAAVRLLDGNLLFGSEAGAVVVNPHYVQQHNYMVNLRLTGVNCNDSDSEQFNGQAAKILGEGKLSLSYRQRTFELYFESINLRYQFDIAYQYRVGKGSWSPLTTQQYIRFVNLEPGTHHLTVRAVSKANRVVLGEQKLVITVSRPWWNSWWMWCIYISFVVSLFYAAWWTYGLHTRYMRLVVSVLEQDNEDVAATSQAGQNQDEVKSDISTDATTDTKQNSDFVDTVTKHILNHISDSQFTVDCLCREMAMSRTMFYVKLKSYTGKSPQEFIRVVRLERAAVLLRSGRHVGKVAWEVGFDNAKYFSVAFKKYFGISPSKFK